MKGVYCSKEVGICKPFLYPQTLSPGKSVLFFQASHLEVAHRQKPRRRHKEQGSASSEITLVIKDMRTTFLKEMLKTALQVAADKRKSNCTCQIEIDVYEQFKLLELLANYQEMM